MNLKKHQIIQKKKTVSNRIVANRFFLIISVFFIFHYFLELVFCLAKEGGVELSMCCGGKMAFPTMKEKVQNEETKH